MQVLKDTTDIIGKMATPEMTTKLVDPPDDDLIDEPNASRIPKQYHIVKTFPIFPKDYADQGYRCYNKDGLWNVVIWPSNNPDSREDVIHLSDAVRLMLDEIQGDMSTYTEQTNTQDVQKSKAAAAQLMQLFDRRTTLLKVALDELTRQVSKHCAERGTLLAFLVDNFLSAFKEIPNQYNNALRVMKKEIDQLKVSLDAKNMELESQGKDLNERIQLMVIERRMEKEWHAQLEEQIKRWKTQIDNYKLKAQEQVKMERDMLEQQIENMRSIVRDLRLENDGLKTQTQFQRNELLKSEKRYADLEQQLQSMNKKNEKLQMQISKQQNGGTITTRSDHNDGNEEDANEEDQQYSTLADGSKLKQLLIEFPSQRQLQQMSTKDITSVSFNLFETMYNANTDMALDDFYATRLLLTEDTPQIAADTARCYLESMRQTCQQFNLSQLVLDFMERKVNVSLFNVFLSLFGFFRAQPFQGNMNLDPQTDVPSVPLSLAWNLTTTMFTSPLGEATVKEINDEIKAVAAEERGKEPVISIVYVFETVLKKCAEFYSKKCTDAQNNFTRAYSRYQRAILQKLPGADTTLPRMDWRTFRDFMKQVRPELTIQELEEMFMEGTKFSDSIASVTSDAFDTLCVSRQVYVNKIKVPGSGKRLRYVPPDMLSIIETAWRSSLRTSVKKAITELGKNEQSQGIVASLRLIDQKLEDSLRNQAAGPFCVQMLYEAATIISNEAVNIAASLPMEKCLRIMEKAINVLNLDDGK
ncbi:hypothetical protein TVAG_027190 [Trichomonas vaginalis G3]|uniref:Uncharacterized protein n=1 Tax=Trichomonas vaginalis (strain ATCC PRA-98 / G3) TaxID=412133 RepID=A2F1G4_TRIV3|nr:hypothetical protein TVAGG3_0947800 [Trichomonas vaginalis G3]EAY01251.1 hypothetical protein TVAG_027190 [Trichomonas vaginalis G3]KAI5486992.1 hypothetical protein TVAGG3_0947800 [Trichomonas vaginalis G3]|eukprot:XP_001314066.1 hypothetical protein [Trichomonas vaginalis G3]